jgi:Flp pilus assembly protein TadG
MDAASSRRGEEGYVIVTVALLLVVLCAFGALAVDIGLLLGARTSAQRAADSGALAGAFSFVANPLAPQPDSAHAQAVATATANSILGQAVTPGEVSVTVDVGDRLVTVDVTRPVGTYFARVLGMGTVTVSARGVGEASSTATGAACTKPWFMPNTVLSTQDACTACAAREVFISAGGSVTSYAIAHLGERFTLKPNNPQDALAPGQFYAIAMADSRGGADYRTNIATCSPQAIYCDSAYQVEPGNMIGPTVQGVRDLIGPNPDVFIEVGRYQRADGTVSDTSPQLITVPVWDTCTMTGFCPGGRLPESGRNISIGVVGFATVFIEGVHANDVLGRLVSVASCGSGGGVPGPAPGEIGPYAVPVRLVRTQ